MPDILCLGEPLVEFVRAEHPEVGPHYVQGFGGDTSNAAIAAARQGARVGYLTALGNDMFGDELMELWSREGIVTSWVRRDEVHPTGIYFVDPDPVGRRFTYLRAGSAASFYGPGDVPQDIVASARILHVSAISQAVSAGMRAAVATAIGIARRNGVLVSYDTNLRLKLWSLEDARQAAVRTLVQTDIALPSEDEVAELWGLTLPDAILDHLLALGPRVVALKRGVRGAVVATPERREEIPPVPATPVDSTGAGDAFAGAFLARHLETGDPFEAGRYAVRVAARTVEGYGAVAPIPRRAEMLDEAQD